MQSTDLRSPPKFRHVAALRQLHHDRIVFPRACIVLAQLGAQPARFDTYYGVYSWVVLTGTAEHIDPDQIFLDSGAVALQGSLDDIPEKFTWPPRTGENGRAQNPIELSLDIRC